jgi:hypothetical protein
MIKKVKIGDIIKDTLYTSGVRYGIVISVDEKSVRLWLAKEKKFLRIGLNDKFATNLNE